MSCIDFVDNLVPTWRLLRQSHERTPRRAVAVCSFSIYIGIEMNVNVMFQFRYQIETSLKHTQNNVKKRFTSIISNYY